MYFNRGDIQAVKNYITERSAKLNVLIGAKDEAGFNKAINSILEEKKYYEGEEIAPKHMTELKSNVNIAIGNLCDYLIRNADTLKVTTDLSNSTEYLATAVDAFFITAMEKLGCPDMPIIHFDKDIKKTLEESALNVSRSFLTFDNSKERALDQQRGKDAKEVSNEFMLIAEGIKNGKKAETVGKMIAEYQALKERQKNNNVLWRLSHRTECNDRNALIEKMDKLIREHLPDGMKNISLDDASPNSVSRNIADELIRSEVEAAGPDRLDDKSILKIYGRTPSGEHILKQEKIIGIHSDKISLGKDERFLNDVMGSDNVKLNQAPKQKEFSKPSLLKD